MRGAVKPGEANWSLALWMALGLNKLALFVYTLALGRLGGEGALGAHASLVTSAGLAGGLLHAGLPDWALYRAAGARAEGRDPPDALRTGHALFLTSAAAAYAGVAACLPLLLPDPAHRAYGTAVVLGLFLAHLSAFALSSFRGRGEPRPEALATFAAAVALAAGALVATTPLQLGAAFVASGTCLALPFAASLRSGATRPQGAALTRGAACVREALPYLALGLGWQLLWATDVLMTRATSGNAEVGLLAAAMLVLRGGLYGASLFGALLLHRVREGERAVRPLLLGLGPVLAGLAVAVAWAFHGLLAHHFSIPAGALRPVLAAGSLAAPVAYTATLWMPVAMGLAPARVTRALAAGVAVALPLGVALRDQGAVGGVVALCAGQGVLLALLGPLVLGRAAPQAPTPPG